MDYTEWYIKERPKYKQLAHKIETILTDVIGEASIEFHYISNRTKTIESFTKKINNPKYDKPSEQITDLAGIRIITYVEDEIPKICKIIEDIFDIDTNNSGDKSDDLGIDKVGYKSVHYIAQLPISRTKLPENKKFTNLKFEIQIRTILQHSWAEIEHDRNYKYSGELPTKIQRRFKLLAGLLELADNEFNSISNEIDKYSNIVRTKTEKGELDIPLNSTSIIEYMSSKFKSLLQLGFEFRFPSSSKVIQELNDFGITSLKQLDDLISKDYINKRTEYYKKRKKGNITGELRVIMMVTDFKKYFKKAYNGGWTGFASTDLKMFEPFGINPKDVENELKKATNKAYKALGNK